MSVFPSLPLFSLSETRNYWHSIIRPAGEAGSFVRGHEDLTLKQWAAFAVRFDSCSRAAD